MELQNEPKFNLIQLSIVAKTWVDNVVKSDDLGVDPVLNAPEKFMVWHPEKNLCRYFTQFIVTCVGRSKAPPIPLLPILHEACGMANTEHSIWPILNDDVILVLAHPYNGKLALEKSW